MVDGMAQTAQLPPRAREAKERFEAGEPYADAQQAMGIGRRRFQQLLQRAGVIRPVGRPRTRPRGRRVSLEATGLL